MVLIKDREVLLDTPLDKHREEEVHQTIHLVEVTAGEVHRTIHPAEATVEEVRLAIHLVEVVAQETLALTQVLQEAQVDLAQETQEVVALARLEVQEEV